MEYKVYLLTIDEPRKDRLGLRFAEGASEMELRARFQIVCRITDHLGSVARNIYVYKKSRIQSISSRNIILFIMIDIFFYRGQSNPLLGSRC